MCCRCLALLKAVWSGQLNWLWSETLQWSVLLILELFYASQARNSRGAFFTNLSQSNAMYKNSSTSYSRKWCVAIPTELKVLKNKMEEITWSNFHNYLLIFVIFSHYFIKFRSLLLPKKRFSELFFWNNSTSTFFAPTSLFQVNTVLGLTTIKNKTSPKSDCRFCMRTL